MPGRLDEKFMKYGVVDFDVWQLTGSRDFTGKKCKKFIIKSEQFEKHNTQTSHHIAAFHYMVQFSDYILDQWIVRGKSSLSNNNIISLS